MAKKSLLDDYIQVTRKNMKMALAVGDHFYLIETSSNGKPAITFHGNIRPRLRKGWWDVKNMPHGIDKLINWDFFIKEDESPNEYKDLFSPLFKWVDSGICFVKKGERIKTVYTLRGDNSINESMLPSKNVPDNKEHQTDFFS